MLFFLIKNYYSLEEGNILLREKSLSSDLLGIAFCDMLRSEPGTERSISNCVWIHLPLFLPHQDFTTAFTHDMLHLPSHLWNRIMLQWTFPASQTALQPGMNTQGTT